MKPKAIIDHKKIKRCILVGEFIIFCMKGGTDLYVTALPEMIIKLTKLNIDISIAEIPEIK